MESMMRQMRAKTSAASQNLRNRTRKYYADLLDRNRQYIAREPSVEKCRELSKQLFFTRLASIPGRYESFWKELDFVKKKIVVRQELTTEELGIGALFALECYLWFAAGEVLGRALTRDRRAYESKPTSRREQ
ncbi:hypothetical protein O6H91_14G039000 [Diphasiastrum complanatum]|uniref:Uncharacterized protein n=1 Tax=Diphasiastrum complanatum TaxID=34168 RepID=A0ACC2BPE5_DIPCM|nr:hypothetical protein O6H91_14G039000 [Diphasiastrum complanatum]